MSLDSKEVSQLYVDLVDDFKKRFKPKNEQIAMLECSPIWKDLRKRFRTIPELKLKLTLKREHGNVMLCWH